METFITTDSFISTEQVLKHWQGHRALTRKMIVAFPDEQLFTFTIGGMRPFSELVREMLGLTDGGIRGLLNGDWRMSEETDFHANTFVPKTKAVLLSLWDEHTELLNELWPQIPAERFQEVEAAFGQYENTNYNTVFYLIDNEIHHRAQGTVYLRALGIQPPFFWDRE